MKCHEMTYRVCYADTDQMGIMYYANYYVLFERGRTEMMRAAGFPYSVMEQKDLLLPAVESRCFYHASAHYDDLLTIRTWAEEFRGVRVRMASEIWHEGKKLASGYVVLACMNHAHKAVKAPDFLKQALQAAQQEEEDHEQGTL